MCAKKKLKPRMSIPIVLSIAILCFGRQVSSWQHAELPGAVAPINSQQTLRAPVNIFTVPNAAHPFADSNEASRQPTSNERQSQAQTSAPSPSAAGKILDSLVSNAIAAAASAATGGSPSRDANSTSTKSADNNGGDKAPASSQAVNIVRYMLKPRKSSEAATKDIEQQIIQQHARVHQHLTPARKFNSAPAFAESDGRDSSALTSIFDNFKSGISSRSTIVKAISDNKLARTLSDVGKTLGSNKYVAGAAAASALAALGLAVSKIITPYMFAGAFAGPEPLMTSGSAPIGSGIASMDPSRYSFGVDSSSPPMSFSPPPTGYSSYSSLQPQFDSYEPATSSPGAYLSGAASTPQASYYTPGIFMQSPVPGPNGKSQQLFITYKHSPAQVAPTATGPGDINGHYTHYYNSQPLDATNFDQFSQANSNYNQAQASDQRHSEYSTSNAVANSNFNSQQGDFASSADQMLPSSSDQVASYVRNQQVVLSRPLDGGARSSQTGRRFGAISLKLKESDRERLAKSSKVLQFARPTFVKTSEYFPQSSAEPFGSAPLASADPTDAKSYRLQQPQTNSLMHFVDKDRDQGQPTPQANNNNNNNVAALRIIRPNLSPADRPEADKRRSSQYSWTRVVQQPAASGPNPIDHQGTSSLSSLTSSSSSDDSADANNQQQRVFRTQITATKALDYDMPTQSDTFEKAGSTSESWLDRERQLSSGADISAGSRVKLAGEQNGSNNINVFNPIEADTKSGVKLAAQRAGQRQQQQQKQNAQAESSTSSSSGGLSIMAAPRQLRPSPGGLAGAADSAERPSTSTVSIASAADGEESSEQSMSRRRDQPIGQTQPEKATDVEDSSAG